MQHAPHATAGTADAMPRSVDLVISGAHVLCCDAARTEYLDGTIAIENGWIVAVGNTPDIRAAHVGRETMHASGQMCMPGLINAHYHPAFFLVTSRFSQRRPAGPGLLAAGGQMDRFLALLGSFDRVGLTDAETEAGATAGLLRLLKTGTTTVNDGGLGTVAGVDAAFRETRMRGISTFGGGGDLDFPAQGGRPETVPGAERALLRAADSIRAVNWSGDGLRRGWFSISTDLNATDEYWKEAKRLAVDAGVGISSHVATVATQDSLSEAIFGRRGITRMAELGLLGPDWMGIHMGFANDAEIDMLAATGATVIHCPATSMGSGKGILAAGTIPRMVERGVTVAIGSDSPQWGDMLQQMQFAFYGHKEASRDDSLFPADTIVDMATLTAARTLLWDDEIGSIEAGKQADLVLIDTDNLRFASLPHPILGLLRAGQGSDIRRVFVKGRELVRDGELVHHDEQAVIARAREAERTLLARL
jgi:5-methylthioadenosine/S-adenosylhomocysteine deaminase